MIADLTVETDDLEALELPEEDILDLPPIVQRQSLVERCWDFVIDTSVIYRYGMTRLGAAQIILGIVSVGLGNALFWLNKHDAWSGVGIWSGVPMFSSGLVCLAFRHKRPARKVKNVYPHSLTCSTGLLASTFLLVSSAVNVAFVEGGRGGELYPHYIKHLPGDESPLTTVNGLLLAVGIVATVISTWALSLCVGYVFYCCRPGRDRIYTISCDDTIDAEMTSDRDFMVDPYDQQTRRRTPMLAIQEPELEYDDEFNTGLVTT